MMFNRGKKSSFFLDYMMTQNVQWGPNISDINFVIFDKTIQPKNVRTDVNRQYWETRE